jgi:hypothetical protein
MIVYVASDLNLNKSLSITALVKLQTFIIMQKKNVEINDLPSSLTCCNERRRNNSKRCLDFSVKLKDRVKY